MRESGLAATTPGINGSAGGPRRESRDGVAHSGSARSRGAALLEGGHVALTRHGNAPPGYGGGPPGFRIDDCATQRNLDERGRQEARALGETFRHHGVRVDRILSSLWCRCLDTARLMAVGPVETSWALVPDSAAAGALVGLIAPPR